MGIYTDYFAATVVTDVTVPIDSQDRTAYRFLLARKANNDAALPSGYDAEDEVQTMTAHAATGGTFTLAFTLQEGETFTTANIAVDAANATIETAVDVAATAASITGWTNGDITVSGGNANTNPVVFTFDGTSVTELNHSDIVVDGALLTGGATGVMSETNGGQAKRLGLAVLGDLGVLKIDTLPGYKAAPALTDFTFYNPGSVHPWAGQAVVEEVLRQVMEEELQESYWTVIRGGFNWS